MAAVPNLQPVADLRGDDVQPATPVAPSLFSESPPWRVYIQVEMRRDSDVGLHRGLVRAAKNLVPGRYAYGDISSNTLHLIFAVSDDSLENQRLAHRVASEVASQILPPPIGRIAVAMVAKSGQRVSAAPTTGKDARHLHAL